MYNHFAIRFIARPEQKPWLISPSLASSRGPANAGHKPQKPLRARISLMVQCSHAIMGLGCGYTGACPRGSDRGASNGVQVPTSGVLSTSHNKKRDPLPYGCLDP